MTHEAILIKLGLYLLPIGDESVLTMGGAEEAGEG